MAHQPQACVPAHAKDGHRGGLPEAENDHPLPGTPRLSLHAEKGREIRARDEAWCADITYVPMACGFMYLVAVMDWFSRYVLAWRLSNTMDTAFCLDALTAALDAGHKPPVIFNTDQGAQFAAVTWPGLEGVQRLASLRRRVP